MNPNIEKRKLGFEAQASKATTIDSCVPQHKSFLEQNPQGENIERRSIFTTAPKKPKTTINISRKGSIVKERCEQLTQIIADLFPNRIISDDDLICLIKRYIGADKETIRSYKGYSGHIRAGRCGDNHIVGLSRKGYLEDFGFLRKIPQRRWMICQTILASKDMTIDVSSKEKISISIPQGERARENRFEKVVSLNGEAIEKLEEEEDTEKERNFAPKIYGELTPLEAAILRAKPCEKPKEDFHGKSNKQLRCK